jgi:hypothetical protein
MSTTLSLIKLMYIIAKLSCNQTLFLSKRAISMVDDHVDF